MQCKWHVIEPAGESSEQDNQFDIVYDQYISSLPYVKNKYVRIGTFVIAKICCNIGTTTTDTANISYLIGTTTTDTANISYLIHPKKKAQQFYVIMAAELDSQIF